MKMMGTCNHLVVGSNPTPGALHRTVQGGAQLGFVLHHSAFFTYVLRSLKDGKMYIGFTQDLRKRFQEHQNGKSTATECRRPLELIFYEAYKNKYDALRREKYFKSSKGKTTLKSMLRDFFKSTDE